MSRLKRFLRDESGMEFLQVAIVVLIVAALAIAVIAIGTAIKEKAEGASQAVGAVDVSP